MSFDRAVIERNKRNERSFFFHESSSFFFSCRKKIESSIRHLNTLVKDRTRRCTRVKQGSFIIIFQNSLLGGSHILVKMSNGSLIIIFLCRGLLHFYEQLFCKLIVDCFTSLPYPPPTPSYPLLPLLTPL